MADDQDFYEDDEPIEDLRAAWKRGERGETKGERRLHRKAKSIVDRTAKRLESPEVVVRLAVVSSGASDTETVEYFDPGIDRVEDSNLTEPLEYQVG